MANDKQDELIRAYARLSALRKNISELKDYNIEEMYVLEYHSVLDKLKDIGFNISEFRIPDSALRKLLRAQWIGGQRYSDEKYVERTLILIKLDSVLGYFEIITSEKPKSIGFRPSNK